MARIKLPRLLVQFPKTFFLLSTLACCGINATLLRTESLQTYVGCYHAWHERYTELKAPEGQPAFNSTNSISSCAEKCIWQDIQAKFIFLRGFECQCSFDVSSIEELTEKAIHLDDGYCTSSCSGQKSLAITESCGGNIAYSVYCVSSVFSNGNCNSRASNISQQYPINKTGTTKLTPLESNAKRNPYPVLDPELPCGLCHLGGIAPTICTPQFASPDFDYFPLNNAQDCANFCDTDIQYVDWESGVPVVRSSTKYAVLLWWSVPSKFEVTVPICACVNSKDKFQAMPDSCKMSCPNNSPDSCGGMDSYITVYGSVYIIENGDAIPTTTALTTMTTVWSTTSIGSSDPTVTEASTTTEITTRTQPSTTTQFHSTSTFPTTTVTSESPPTTTTPTSTSTTTTPTSTSTTTPMADIVDDETSKHCSGKDRRGREWSAKANCMAFKDCSDLISDSTGQAYWKCNGTTGNFEPEQPNISNCSSSWVRSMESKLAGVNSTDTAINLILSLLSGCGNQSPNSKYYGHEIEKIIVVVDGTLKKVRQPETPLRRSDKQEGFEDLVDRAIDVNACLVNSADPWEDLLPLEKSSLSTKLMDATEDVLFHFTQYKYVGPNQGYRKEFTPMDQFTAVAEVFAKSPNETYEYDQLKCDREGNGKSCVKLPPGWTRELPEEKVEIAIITIEPESVAKVMTGTGVYEVNGQRHKILNGRLLSFSVTSSPRTVKSEFHGVRSKSLNFSDKGIEIYFPHIVDAYGGQVYEIPRKLHKGEKPRAAMGSAQCVYWAIGENGWSHWSTRGCKLVNTSRLETVCECSHLTSFAVLMDVHRYVGKQRALEILTLILCPLSELSLLLTIIILSISRNHAHKVRTTICTHLSLCLFIGNAMILLVLDRNYLYLSDGVCMGAAMATHYVFLCAFMWMLFEGVQLYRVVIHVFDSGRSYMRQYGILAYGTPLIIISITAAVGHIKGDKPYGGDPYCWLLGNYIWTFMVPVAVVITVNLTVLFIALKTSFQLQHQRQREIKLSSNTIMEKILSYRVHFKGCFTLTVILGLTWIVGFFTLMEGQSKMTAAYLFTILNASQGFFIFVFTCHTYIGNLRRFTRRKLSTYFPSFLNTSSSESPIINRKPCIISKGKLGFGRDNGKS